MLSPKYKLDRTSTALLQYLTGYVTWRCDLDLLTLESCHVMQLGWSMPVRSLNWIGPKTYLSRVRTTTIFHWPPAWIPNF